MDHCTGRRHTSISHKIVLATHLAGTTEDSINDTRNDELGLQSSEADQPEIHVSSTPSTSAVNRFLEPQEPGVLDAENAFEDLMRAYPHLNRWRPSQPPTEVAGCNGSTALPGLGASFTARAAAQRWLSDPILRSFLAKMVRRVCFLSRLSSEGHKCVWIGLTSLRKGCASVAYSSPSSQGCPIVSLPPTAPSIETAEKDPVSSPTAASLSLAIANSRPVSRSGTPPLAAGASAAAPGPTDVEEAEARPSAVESAEDDPVPAQPEPAPVAETADSAQSLPEPIADPFAIPVRQTAMPLAAEPARQETALEPVEDDEWSEFAEFEASVGPAADPELEASLPKDDAAATPQAKELDALQSESGPSPAEAFVDSLPDLSHLLSDDLVPAPPGA